MGRTNPSTTQVFMQEEAALANFKYALRKSDQAVMDELMVYARLHLSAAAESGYFLPAFMFLLSMLIEMLKIIKKMQAEIDQLKVKDASRNNDGVGS